MSIISAIGGILFMLATLGIMFFYVGRKLFQFLKVILKKINIKVYISVYVVVILMMVGGVASSSISMPTIIKVVLRFISSFLMGIFVYNLILFLIADIVLMIGKFLKIVPRPITSKICFISGLIVISLTLVIDVYGVFNGNNIKNKSYNINTSNNTDNKDNRINIALISDVHLGAVNSENRLNAIVNKINTIKPDIVCITGDIFDNDYNAIYNPQKAIDILKRIKSTYGVYACFGNHDTGNTVGNMLDFLKKSNIKLLKDEYKVIDNKLILVGRLDSSLNDEENNLYRKNTSELIKEIKNKHTEGNLPILVMDHNPIHIKEYGKEVDLILCGHTHRGQIFPGSLFTNNIFDVDYGHYQKNGNSPHIIVTSGVGTWGLPMRVGTDSEVVNIKFKF